MKKITIIILGIVVFLLGVGFYTFNELAGTFYNVKTYKLDKKTKEMVDNAFADIENFRDYHAHLVGIGKAHSGCSVHENMQTPIHLSEYLRYQVYIKSSGVKDPDETDQQYIERMVELIEHGYEPNSKFVLLAFDKHYNLDGTVNEEKTQFYVPNEYVDSICVKYPDYFLPCISVHPYRKDALEELEKWGNKGVKQVKWLPNAMGMNPSSEKCIPFYTMMKKYNMTLLSHAGHEKAVHAEEDQKYGNPLLLKMPLENGVKVIMAHCASLGENEDLEDQNKKIVPNIDLFLRMMADTSYTELLYADISAITQYNRLSVLDTLLTRKDLHPRLINGSDYPLPAINVLIHTEKMEKLGYISAQERKLLNEVYHYNPLLFDFVLKRTIKHPKSGETFSSEIFEQNPLLGY